MLFVDTIINLLVSVIYPVNNWAQNIRLNEETSLISYKFGRHFRLASLLQFTYNLLFMQKIVTGDIKVIQMLC